MKKKIEIKRLVNDFYDNEKTNFTKKTMNFLKILLKID